MRSCILIHIPHSSLYIPDEYKNKSLLSLSEIEKENLFMCDYRVDEFVDDKSQTIIFPYSRLYCDVERFKDESEIMNKFGMGYIYTKTSKGELMFNPSIDDRKKITDIYDTHHKLLDETVTNILELYQKCIIIDLHSYSTELVSRLFNYEQVPDICIGIDKDYYSKGLTDYFVKYFMDNGYSVKINYPYQGSLVPNKYYGIKNSKIISIMIEINKRVYENDFESFKHILKKSLEF
ncbi:MAG: N-formylglutamate amidohydrolase [Bacilli bacterium]|nr:N-formylglutamate amidohydrolase [Bacilli bacterium]